MFIVTYVLFVICIVGVGNGLPLSLGKIIGGVDAPDAYSPHMVALIFGAPVQLFMCGGSIISTKLVLTAAHCIEALQTQDGQLIPSFQTRVGSNKWNSGGTIVQIKNHHIHSQWDPKNIKYDVGILVLERQVVPSDSTAIVELSYEYVGGKEKSTVTGWGRTGPRIDGDVVHLAPIPDKLQLLDVNTLSHEQCWQQLKEVAGDSWVPPIQNEVELCAFHSYNHGMCAGDSGSALILRSTKKQIGIVSWGFGCAQGAPDVFVRLYGVRKFIKTFMAIYKD